MVEIRKLNLLAIVNSICGKKLDFALYPYRDFPEIFNGLGTILGVFKIDLRKIPNHAVCIPSGLLLLVYETRPNKK